MAGFVVLFLFPRLVKSTHTPSTGLASVASSPPSFLFRAIYISSCLHHVCSAYCWPRCLPPSWPTPRGGVGITRPYHNRPQPRLLVRHRVPPNQPHHSRLAPLPVLWRQVALNQRPRRRLAQDPSLPMAQVSKHDLHTFCQNSYSF